MTLRQQLVLCLWLVTACKPGAKQVDSSQGSVYREELLARLRTGQAIGDSFTQDMRKLGWPSATTAARMTVVDSRNTSWLKRKMLTEGFRSPSRSVVME